MIKHISLLILLTFIGFNSFAQQKEGLLEFVIDVNAMDTSLQVRQQVGMLRNSSMKVYFMRDKSRIDFKMGEMYAITSIVDWKINRSLSLFSTPKGKFATKMEASKFNESLPKPDTTLTVELIDEHKTILGYKCKKAIMRSDSIEYIYWYTNDIKIDLNGQSIINSNIPGLPMEFQTVKDGVMMNFKASNLTFSVPDKKTIFSTAIPAGYIVVTDVD